MTFPTKKGITFQVIKSLTLATDMVDTHLNKDLHYHIGGNIFITVRSGNPCVDLRKNWKSENGENLVLAKKGICLRPIEDSTLKSHASTLDKEVPKLETILPCFVRTIIYINMECSAVQHVRI